MEFVKGNIVKFSNLTVDGKKRSLNLIGRVETVSNYGATPYSIYVIIDENTLMPVAPDEIILATEREAFLYHLHGSRCLQIKEEPE